MMQYEIRCLWCDWKARYNEDGAEAARKRAMKHDAVCPNHPLAIENGKLRKANEAMTRLTQGRFRVLSEYLNPRRRDGGNEMLRELAELARGTLPDSDVMVFAHVKAPDRCVLCQSDPVCPFRIEGPQLTTVALLCQSCYPPTPSVETDARVLKEIADLDERYMLESAFMWTDSGRMKMLTDGLKVETIR